MPTPTASSAQSTHPQTVTQFRALIWHSLDNDLLETALFTSERLYAYDSKTPDSAHLYALCLLRNAQYRQAEALTKKWLKHVGCAYVYAQCCLKLGDTKLSDGVAALEGCKRSWGPSPGWNQHTDTERKVLPDAAAIHCLIGRLWHALGDTKKAVDAYVAAVKVNPFLWEAFTGLCDTGRRFTSTHPLRPLMILGVNLRVNNIFKQSPEMVEYCKVMANVAASEEPPARTRNGSENLQNDPFISSGYTRDRGDLAYNNHPSFFNRLNEGTGSASHLDTPTAQPSGSGQSDLLGVATGAGDKPPPVRKTRAAVADAGVRKLTSRSVRDNNAEMKRPISSSSTGEPTIPAAPARRSTRLNTLKFSSKLGSGAERETRLSAKDRTDREQKKRAVSTRLKSNLVAGGKDKDKEDVNVRDNPTSSGPDRTVRASTQHATDAGNGSLKRKIAPSEPSLTRVSKKQMSDVPPARQQLLPIKDKNREDAQLYLLDLYRRLGNGYFNLNRYNCPESLQVLGSLPSSQRETPRIQCLMGKAYYEMAQYNEAEALFSKVRTMDPVRSEDMEVFSTILWHQRKDVELSFLARELMDLDRASPEAWCALGNSFSLQRDHDQALKCFKRATMLNPKLAYAFTLQGHEHVSNEEYEKALVSYRNAVAADNRHYNAWYGLGKVYEKMGKYEVAEKHFRTASKINPTNAVLICCVGMVLEKMKDFDGALCQYNEAVKISPKSALSRFKKARTLMSMQNYQAALEELTILKDLAPDEANVHFTLGRLYKSLHNKTLAIKHLTIALNLDPKAGHLIKEVIENLDEDDDTCSIEDSEVYRLLEGDA
ncbi:hypothetical protein FN846DRAFT_901190 [Sphaerosporella brunnea]|uniref:Protein bimA n=1 Tax=Sphaerosporella brunnea TaxID=1250544 RepID=A0A5J5EFN0_9PEZI|nr:hypothetical protein FN846DRAFT_901190 [Sphaerosporella brunnea]